MIKAKAEKTTKKNLLTQAERAIVAPDALAGLQRRAEDLGLIIHARQSAQGAGGARKPKRGRAK